MGFEQSELSRSIEQSQCDGDKILDEISRHIDDCDIAMRRETILDIIEDNINENGTVSVYDIARINEVVPESNLRNLGSDENVAAALNAIGSNKAGLFRIIVALLLGVAGIGMMVYGFIQQNKEHKATIDSIRSSSEAIKKNTLQFKTVTISLNDKPLINDEVISIYGKIKELWSQIVGPDGKSLTSSPEDFIKNPVYPISEKTKEINKIIQTKIWRGEVSDVRRLNLAVSSLTSDLSATSNKVEKWFDAFLEHMTKGRELPSQFPDFIEALYIKDPFTGKQTYPGGILESFLTATQTAWPHRYPESSLTKEASAELTAAKTAYSMDFILKGASANIADACTYAMEMGSNSAENIKRISELSTKIASRLKIAEDKAKHSLENLEGIYRGDYKVHLTKVRGQLSDFNKLNEAISRSIINGVAVGKQTDKFLKQLKAFDDLVSSMRYKAYKAAGEKKAAGNNGIGFTFGLNSLDEQSTWVDDTIVQAASATKVSVEDPNDPTDIANAFDEAGLDKYLEEAELEITAVEKLRDIADRIQESGTISRADVNAIENAAPGLLSYMEDQPNFTFRPSTVGLEPALNALGDRISAKGGILAAIIAAILGVIGFIIAKVFGGNGGAGKAAPEGIPSPAPEVKTTNEAAKATADKEVEETKRKWREEDERKRKEWARENEERLARLAEQAREASAEQARQIEAEKKKIEEEQKKRAAERAEFERESRIMDPAKASDIIGSRPEAAKSYIFSIDKTDAHLPESVLVIYRQIVNSLLRYGSSDAVITKNLSVSWLLRMQPSIASFSNKESVNDWYNTFIYAPDAVKRVKTACALLDGVGEKIDEISDLTAKAHNAAVKFWSKKPTEFRSVSDFNDAMSSTGLGDALSKLKERSVELQELTGKINPVRAELKYNFIDVTKSDAIAKMNPIPVQIDALNTEYAKHTLPSSILKFRDSMENIQKKISNEDRHQDYHGGMRGSNFYMADNVYGSKGLSGKDNGRGVNLELRKKLIEAGMPAEVFASIARIQREQIDFVNQAHRRIQGAVNSSAYVLGDLRRFYEAAVSRGHDNVKYQEQLKSLIDAFRNKDKS